MLLLTLIGPALAQDPPEPTLTLAERVDTHAALRVLGSIYPDVEVDADGTTVGQGPVLDTRLRAGGTYTSSAGWILEAELDAFDAQLIGTTWQLGDQDQRSRHRTGVGTLDAFQVRELSVKKRDERFEVEVGIQPSHWGLGMLANDGAHEPLFGRNDGGDIVLRARASSRIGDTQPLLVTIATDRVISDDLARVVDDEIAYQGVLALVWYAQNEMGLYGVFRQQQNLQGEVTRFGVVDSYLKIPLSTGGYEINWMTEGAGIVGTTTQANSANSPGGLQVRTGGVASQIDIKRENTQAILRAGWAAGDGDPYDDTTTDFAADPNFDVGMVLYDQVLGAIDARAYQMLEDPSNIGSPPNGAETLVAEGAWRHGTYLQPAVVFDRSESLQVRAGTLFAWSTVPVGQAFYSGRAGGTPTSHRNTPWSGSYHLGTELNWAVEVSRKAGAVDLSAELEAGYLIPGRGLDLAEDFVVMHMLTLNAAI